MADNKSAISYGGVPSMITSGGLTVNNYVIMHYFCKLTPSVFACSSISRGISFLEAAPSIVILPRILYPPALSTISIACRVPLLWVGS